jgi:trehalose/maltose transport system permease protein
VVGTSALSRQRRRSAWLFLVPALTVMGATAGWPLLRTFWFAFTDASIDQPAAGFIGLENFRGLVEDPDWWKSVWNTFRYALVSVTLETVLGMIIALALNAHFQGRGVLRAAVLVPWAIPTIVSARLWAWMLHDVYGVINELLLSVHLISEPLAWTAEPGLSLLAVILVDVWKTTPFMTLLLLAALQLVPQEVYEAARLDGAGPVRTFFSLTLPIIRGPLLVAVIFRMLDALRAFDLFYVLTNNSADVMSMAVYARQRMAEFGELGYSSAAASMLFLLIATFTVSYLVITRVSLDPEA